MGEVVLGLPSYNQTDASLLRIAIMKRKSTQRCECFEVSCEKHRYGTSPGKVRIRTRMKFWGEFVTEPRIWTAGDTALNMLRHSTHGMPYGYILYNTATLRRSYDSNIENNYTFDGNTMGHSANANYKTWSLTKVKGCEAPPAPRIPPTIHTGISQFAFLRMNRRTVIYIYLLFSATSSPIKI